MAFGRGRPGDPSASDGDQVRHVDTPFEALDLHLSQWEWMGTAAHRSATDLFMDTYYGIDSPRMRAERREGVPREHQTGKYLALSEEQMLNRAQTFYITSEINQLIAEAGASMPPAPLRVQDIPVQTGFLVLPEPLPYFQQGHELTGPVEVSAVAWQVTDVIGRGGTDFIPGVALLLYSDTNAIYEAVGEPWNREGMGAPPPFMLIDYLGWGSGTDWAIDPNYDNDNLDYDYIAHATAPHVGELRKYLLALWTFMSQKIVPSTRVRPRRPQMRRWDRSGIEVPEDGMVTLVHLRPYLHNEQREEDPDAEAPYWSHRWIVRGHWRNIADGEGGRRLVWVRSYIKGPEDRPLVIKDRLGVIHR